MYCDLYVFIQKLEKMGNIEINATQCKLLTICIAGTKIINDISQTDNSQQYNKWYKNMPAALLPYQGIKLLNINN